MIEAIVAAKDATQTATDGTRLRWDRTVLRGEAMPETPVDENLHPLTRESDVDCAAWRIRRSIVHSKPHPSAKQNFPQRHLWLGVPAAIRHHHRAR